MFTTILLAVDGSGHARRAVDCAIDISAKYKAKLIILTVHPHGPLSKALADFAASEDLGAGEVYRRIVDDLGQEAAEHEIAEVVTLVEEGDASQQILAAAEKHDVSLIVMGSRGMSELKGLLVGSVSHKVMHLCDRPCLVVH